MGRAVRLADNMESQDSWNPHCLDLLEPAMSFDGAILEDDSEEEPMYYDDHGNPIESLKEEAEVDFLVRKELKEGEIFMHQYIEETKQSLGYHLEMLGHMDQL